MRGFELIPRNQFLALYSTLERDDLEILLIRAVILLNVFCLLSIIHHISRSFTSSFIQHHLRVLFPQLELSILLVFLQEIRNTTAATTRPKEYGPLPRNSLRSLRPRPRRKLPQASRHLRTRRSAFPSLLCFNTISLQRSWH